ncbi:hypothetical protein CIB84_003487 [Bambusicola thoracicus]|uniref:threonine--tRNA ligase n=1 Tax=Bambusicola thoracicus TaxID=9083 RepID=A0A2P4T8U1_BAMTH|nr:hypothetical protein CIB84_003487 [Bambusicola thoracicus]
MAAAEAAELRVSRQEQELRWLAAEVGRLKEREGPRCAEGCSPELQRLRAENEKLRYRLLHLRRSLAAELARAAPAEPRAGSEEASTARPAVVVDQKEKEAISGHKSELQCEPSFIEDRLKLYETLKKEHDALLAYRAANETKPIKITLTDGKIADGESWKTTPYQLAVGISQGLASNAVIAKVNGELWDLDRPLEGDCTLELLTFDDQEAQAVYWHSSAHILGEAMEGYYGGCLCYGPPIENGFYYDMYIEDRGVSSTEFPALENRCKNIIKEKQPFERLEVKKEILLDMFKNSSTYWEGKADMETLQRIYGISFPDNKMMKEWEKFQEEARNRDHRKIGKEEYHRRNFTEVVSPNIYNSKLWETSGHWQHYSENMFSFDIEKETFALKPMNCPGHCLMFAHRPRSWREMPLRLADFGVLHRNELSGTLSGLTRVRRFQQDDAHIFCTIEQQLQNSLDNFGVQWTLNPGDGAFYGPKLPIRFNLTYVGKDGDDKKRPVIIHRAVLGSVERMIAILAENYGGKWPFWLSPRQVMVVPVGPTSEQYAQQVCSEFFEAGFMSDVDLDQSCTLNKKIRNAQLAQYNFILVVGEKEKANHAVNVRTRDNKVHGEISVSSAIEKLKKFKSLRLPNAEEEF